MRREVKSHTGVVIERAPRAMRWVSFGLLALTLIAFLELSMSQREDNRWSAAVVIVLAISFGLTHARATAVAREHARTVAFITGIGSGAAAGDTPSRGLPENPLYGGGSAGSGSSFDGDFGGGGGD